jgi:crossover junction endodeoxyribonuclease RuvC
MIILGIDTAIRCSGYGVIELQVGHNPVVIDCGIIKTPAKAPHSECLRRIFGGVNELCENFKPDHAAIESAFYHKNIKTAMILSYARGAVMTALAIHEIPAYAYAPRVAKKALTGSGAASKIQVATMIAATCNLDMEDIQLDSTDAISIAICHAQKAIMPNSSDFLSKPL